MFLFDILFLSSYVCLRTLSYIRNNFRYSVKTFQGKSDPSTNNFETHVFKKESASNISNILCS